MNPTRLPLIVLVAAFAAVTAPACNTLNGLRSRGHAPAESDAISRTMEESVALAKKDAARARRAPPIAVAEELLPPFRVGKPSKGEPFEQRFDVTVSNAPAREFFMSLVADTPYNMVLDPAVDGVITLALKNVTIDEVMQAVRDVYGYEYRKTSYGYHVQPDGLQTRIFELDYLNVQRSGSSRTNVISGQVSNGGRDSDSDGGSGSGTGPASGVSGSEISTSNQTDFWSELEDNLFTIVGSGEGRSIAMSPNTGIVVVRAMPAELRAVAAYLKKAELSLQRQVVLEAKILEVRLNDRFQSGINWALILDSDPESAIIRALQLGGGSILENAALSDILDNQGFLDRNALNVPDPPAGMIRPDPLFGGTFVTTGRFDNYAYLIELLERQGTVRTLSSPRVSTVNNQKAVIKVGQDEFFVTDVSSTTVTGTTTTTTPDVELTPFFSGIALDVTPQISEHGDIILHIHPSISDVEDQNKIITVGGLDQSLPLALSTIRESDSVVRARSGQVIVIGGLMQENTLHDRAGVPWLSRIPLLGYLFRQQLDKVEKTELVTLLRAVLVERDTWKSELEETADRIEKLTHESQHGSSDGAAKQGKR